MHPTFGRPESDRGVPLKGPRLSGFRLCACSDFAGTRFFKARTSADRRKLQVARSVRSLVRSRDNKLTDDVRCTHRAHVERTEFYAVAVE